jgi:hypothetical protein
MMKLKDIISAVLVWVAMAVMRCSTKSGQQRMKRQRLRRKARDRDELKKHSPIDDGLSRDY